METDARVSTPTRRFWDLLLIVVFAALLVAPTIDLFVRDDVTRGPRLEKRLPAPRPELPRSSREVLSFPRGYETYWSDTFGLRDKLLRGHSALKVLALGVSPDHMHVVGKQGWIFNTNDQMIDAWRGAIAFTPEQLATWQERLERRRRAVEELGAHYLFAVVPDKPAIYPEFMPERFNRIGPTRTDQLYEHLRAHSTVDVLDLRPALLAEKVRDQPGDYVYYRLGTHWERRGALAGYNAFVEHLRPRFPTLPLLPLSEHQLLDVKGYGDSEAAAMYIADLMPQREQFYSPERDSEFKTTEPRRQGSPVLVRERDLPGLPRIVMFHDSFGGYFEKQWGLASSHMVMLHSYEFDLAYAATHKPDLVIEMVVERALVFLRPEHRTLGERHTLGERFAGSKSVLYALDPLAPSLKPLRKAVVQRASDEQGAFVSMKAASNDSAFELEGFTPHAARRLLARVVVDADHVGKVVLTWLCEGEDDWRNSRRAEHPVVAGRNELFFVLHSNQRPVRGLRLVLHPRPGAWRLHALELRVDEMR